MPRQENIILLTGRVGDLSYYRTKRGGYFVRRKSGVSRERIMSEPAFARTRDNIAEFRSATLAAKLFRQTFAPLFESADNQVSSRLTGRMVKVIQGDTTNPRGHRNVTHGDLSLLEGFAMNRKTSLPAVFGVPYTTSIDRATGTMTVDVPSFIPANLITAPTAATHYRLKSAGAIIDFGKNTSSVTISKSSVLALNEERQPPLQLTHHLLAGSRHPLFLILGIEFLQMVNGTAYPLANAGHNAMAILRVDGSRHDECRRDHEEQPARRTLLRRSVSSRRKRTARPPLHRPPAYLPKEGVLIRDNGVFVKRDKLEWEVDSS